MSCFSCFPRLLLLLKGFDVSLFDCRSTLLVSFLILSSSILLACFHQVFFLILCVSVLRLLFLHQYCLPMLPFVSVLLTHLSTLLSLFVPICCLKIPFWFWLPPTAILYSLCRSWCWFRSAERDYESVKKIMLPSNLLVQAFRDETDLNWMRDGAKRRILDCALSAACHNL